MTKAMICVAAPLFVLWLPMNQVLQGIDVVQVRMLAIFTLAVLCWVLEPIPYLCDFCFIDRARIVVDFRQRANLV